jgi:hypothetical protein
MDARIKSGHDKLIPAARCARVLHKSTSGMDPVLLCEVRLIRQSKDRPGKPEPAQLEFAHRGKPRRAMTFKLLRGQDCTIQFAGQFFDTGGQINGRPDAGKIQPISAPNISVQDLSHMERQPEMHITLNRIGRRNCSARLMRGRKGVITNLTRIFAADDRENGEQSIADEFQDFPTMLHDRRHLAVKISIEHVNQYLRWQAIGQAREPAHIR